MAPAKGVRATGLPAELSSFVGRRAELTALKRRLADGRLVTLVGIGGVGKTRLALRAAAERANRLRSFDLAQHYLELALEVARDDAERGLVLRFVDLDAGAERYLGKMVDSLPAIQGANAPIVVSEIVEPVADA